MAEFKLSFTASEIDEKLKKVDSITSGISSWNELTDKPFYEEQKRVEILAETTLEFESDPQIMISPSPFILVEGEKYLVVWNGVEYECVCVLDTVLHSGQPCLTDFSENAEGATGNFIIIYGSSEFAEAEGGMAVFQTFADLGTHTLSIYQDTTVIKYVDNKYLEILEGEEKHEVEILPEQTITLEADNADNLKESPFYFIEQNTALASTLVELNAGETYKVTWGDVEYFCEAQDMMSTVPDDMTTITYHKCIALGNMGIAGTEGYQNTGEPFLMSIIDMTDTQTEGRTKQISIITIPGITETTYDVAVCVKQVSGGYKIKPEYLPDTASGGSAEIPVFDLAAMGMETVDINSNSSAMIETDTTEIYAALDKGAVTFSLSVTMNGETVTGICTAHSLKSMEYEQHQCVASLWLGNDLSYIAINVTKSGYIQVAALPMAQMVKDFVDAVNKTATTVDLSAYESNGTIVETYSDGSTITYTMEFDTNGHPTKVTDSKGNVTRLTW